MDYRFEITKPDSADFRCEIAINGEHTFQQFHDKLVEVLSFDGSQMASFFTLDKVGNRKKEIALMEMATDEEDEEDESTLVMDVTIVREIVNSSCIELEYVYDFFANKYLKVEYAGEYVGDSADVLPLCLYCDGTIPVQTNYNVNEDWAFDKDDDDDDDSLEEFGGGRRGGGSTRNDDDEDYRFDDDDDYKDDYKEEGDGEYDDRYESLDDYIDKL